MPPIFRMPINSRPTYGYLTSKQDNKILSSAGAQQESLIIQDLLNIFMGFDGNYIFLSNKDKLKSYEFRNLGEDYPITIIKTAANLFPAALQHADIKEYIKNN